MAPFPLKVFIVVQCYAVLSAFKHCLKRRSLCGRVSRPSMSEGDGFLDQPARTLSGMLSTNPLFSLASKAYSFFYWFPRNNLPYDKPWILFRNNTIEWLAWYQFPHNLPPYGYLGEGYPQDFFCWGLSGNTLPLGNWDPWGLHQVSKKVVQKYRESELKHGRIAMVACLGFLTQEVFHPLYDGRIQGLAITHMAQLREVHDTGLLQHYLLEPLLNTINVPIPDLAIPLDYWTLLVAVGAVECASLVRRWTRWDRNEYNHQFDYNIGIGNIRQSEQMGGAFYEGLSASDKNFLVNAELNHGRLAMIAIVGMILQEYLTVAKLNVNKTSSRRKMRKAHFGATSVERRTRMSSPLSKELFQRHHVRSLPVRVEDEVRVLRGGFKGKEGKVVQCYRKKYVIHVERCTRDKANGQTIHVGIDASNVEITKIKMDKSRKSILDRKNRVKIGQSKGDAATANIVD